jgi:putative redox protein
VELAWEGDHRFSGRLRDVQIAIDGDGTTAVSPVETLAFALASCMATDVVMILTKGREDLRALRVQLTGWRAEEEPRRFLRIDLRFIVTGDVAPDRMLRALALSREKYCSVWHSMRQDIDLTLAYEFA